ncbi:MAG TPA: glycosyltransferase family 2 protein [Thermoanaerobaculia bacterium]|nr:glycosyltransferase family 2 protein [Thermoanaerobaculia bacterium]
MIELSVVMPCLNEAETLATCIRKAMRFLQAHGVEGEVVIADNGSTDGSQQIARSHGARVVDVPARGYGSALRAGVTAARGKYVVMGDSDDSYDFSALMPFLEKLRAGYQLVMGNRFRGGIAPGAMPPLHRYLGNPVLSGIGKLFFRTDIGDFHCGLRGFERDAILGLDLQTTGMEFASEMVVKSALLGLKVTEVPTTLSPDGRSRAPHLRSWRDGWRHLRFMLLYSPRWLFLYPGLALIAIGVLGGAWLIPASRTLFGVTFDVHTLLYAAVAVLIGFQAVFFAISTKAFAVSAGLIPPDRRVDRLFRIATLEIGIAAGALLVLIGIGGTLFAVYSWSRVSFGPLVPTRTLRIAIPSIVAMALGCQTVLSAFFLNALGLGRK